MPGEQLPIIATFEGGLKGYFMTWHKLFLCHTIGINLEKLDLFMSQFYFYFLKLEFNKFYTFNTFFKYPKDSKIVTWHKNKFFF